MRVVSCGEPICAIPRNLIDEYLWEPKKRRMTKSARQTYRYALGAIDSYLHSEMLAIEELNDGLIQDVADWLSNNYARSTARLYLYVFKSFLEWRRGVEAAAIANDPFKIDDLHCAGPCYALTNDQAIEILKASEGRGEKLIELRNFAMSSLVLLCGFTPIDLEEANIGDVCELEGEPCIRMASSSDASENTLIPLGTRAWRALQVYLAAREREKKYSLPSSSNSALFVSFSPSSRGRRLKSESIAEIIQTIFAKADHRKTGLAKVRIKTNSVILASDAKQSCEEIRKCKNCAKLKRIGIR